MLTCYTHIGDFQLDGVAESRGQVEAQLSDWGQYLRAMQLRLEDTLSVKSEWAKAPPTVQSKRLGLYSKAEVKKKENFNYFYRISYRYWQSVKRASLIMLDITPRGVIKYNFI